MDEVIRLGEDALVEGRFHRHRITRKKSHFELDIREKVLHGIAENFFRQGKLLIIFHVHKIVKVTVLVQKFQLLLIQNHPFHPLIGTKTVVRLVAAIEIP